MSIVRRYEWEPLPIVISTVNGDSILSVVLERNKTKLEGIPMHIEEMKGENYD